MDRHRGLAGGMLTGSLRILEGAYVGKHSNYRVYLLQFLIRSYVCTFFDDRGCSQSSVFASPGKASICAAAACTIDSTTCRSATASRFLSGRPLQGPRTLNPETVPVAPKTERGRMKACRWAHGHGALKAPSGPTARLAQVSKALDRTRQLA